MILAFIRSKFLCGLSLIVIGSKSNIITGYVKNYYLHRGFSPVFKNNYPNYGFSH